MVLVAFVNKDHVNHRLAVELFNRLYSGRIQVFISAQNILEYSTVLAEGYKLPVAEVAKSIESLINDPNFLVIYPTPGAIKRYASGFSTKRLHPVDFFLLTTMQDNDIDSIITDDRDFGKIKGVKVYNPFV